MTHSISNLTMRLVKFETQIEHFKTEAKSLKKEETCSEDKFKKLKSDYKELNMERESLKKAVLNIEKTAEKSFQISVLHTFYFLNKSCRRLDDKFNRYYATATIGRDLDDLSKRYMALSVNEGRGPKQMDEIKKSIFQLVDKPAITASQLKKSLELDNSITKVQKDLVSGQLRELYQLVQWHPGDLEAKKQNNEKMNKLFYEQLPSSMLGSEVQKQICKKVKSKQTKYFVTKELDIASPIPYSLISLRKIPVFKNLNLLSKIIFDHPLFPRNEPKTENVNSSIDNKEEYISSNCSDAEEEIKEVEQIATQEPEQADVEEGNSSNFNDVDLNNDIPN